MACTSASGKAHREPAEAVRRRHARRRAAVPKDLRYKDLAKLVIAIERHGILVAPKHEVRQELREPVTV